MRELVPALLVLVLFGAVGILAWTRSSAPEGFEAPAGPPQRIVSTLPGLTEMIVALGAGDRLVAVSPHCDTPKDVVDAVPHRVSVLPLDVEGIVAAEPDLVVVDRTMLAADLPRLREKGFRVLALETSQTLEGLADAFEDLAEALGGEDAMGRAVAWRTRMDKTLADLGRSEGTGPSVLLVGWFDPLNVLGQGSLLHDLVTRLGARNVADEVAAASAAFAHEAVLADPPEVILHFGRAMPDEVRTRWGRVPAVVRGRVHPAERPELVRAGPRILDGLHWLAARLEGEDR